MKNQILSDCKASFLFWIENSLLNDGQAFFNKTSKLFYKQDNSLPNYVTYSSPFKQWAYDTSISGAQICSGISGSVTLANNQSGMVVDYENGRIILPTSFGTGLNISGSYAVKEFNIYLTNETEAELITSSKFYLNSRYNQNATGAIPPYSIVTPAIFINALNTNTEGFALGGLKQTKIALSTVVLADTMDNLDATLSFLTDKSEKFFPLINKNLDPVADFGGVRTGIYPNGYSYSALKGQHDTPGNLFYIESVRGSKLSDRFKTSERSFVGIADFEITKERYA